MRKRDFLLHAKECTAELYTGWWLYFDPIIDGKPTWCNDSLWLRGDVIWQGRVRRLAAEHGVDNLPEYGRYSQAFAEAFGKAFPEGIVVRATEACRCLCGEDDDGG